MPWVFLLGSRIHYDFRSLNATLTVLFFPVLVARTLPSPRGYEEGGQGG